MESLVSTMQRDRRRRSGDAVYVDEGQREPSRQHLGLCNIQEGRHPLREIRLKAGSGYLMEYYNADIAVSDISPTGRSPTEKHQPT